MPLKIETRSHLPVWPADGVIVGVNGKKGLAYRPGLEFVMWLHQPGWPAFYPDLSAAASLTGPAETLVRAWFTSATAAAAAVADDGAATAAVAPVDAALYASMPTFQKCYF